MTDQEKQNTFGEPQYCKCGKLLEKARTWYKRGGVCFDCRKKKAKEYWDRRKLLLNETLC